ncbi:MAG: Flp pilus assembly complex ATPase component TadA [Firmicutes bacterium]|uniref:Stage III sporulation protein AA n=1 Tax=Sulfobacillus benefaciens TaxID=453960 RepID=A0A2T2XBK4_9FIRM|nr:Flp pilus assembly complex ATPase component TadA [Bacillota bacterium]MCL5014775.1 Flp pilus assembly complex ATPase component TadA [Bacillota bacterium]PSR31903.1 MAG: stage III sporulation protein AA [Sulfobacillus benefaciens]
MEPWTYLPNPWRTAVLELPRDCLGLLEEVRFRLNRPVYCYGTNGVVPLKIASQVMTIQQQDLDHIVGIIADHSLYARTEELRQGFLSLPGGHRVGVAGKAVWKDGQVVTMTDISGLNFRRARNIRGAAQSLISLFRRQQLDMKSVLVAGPPRSGKTTLLRDLIRMVSESGERVAVIDERSELAAYHRGHYGFDLGAHIDVLDGWPKAEGMMLAIRTLGPDRVVVDELGNGEDLPAVRRALTAGVKVVASVHAGTCEDLRCQPTWGLSLLELFDSVAILQSPGHPGVVREVWHKNQKIWQNAS